MWLWGKGTTRGEILELLSTQWPLSAVKIYKHLNNQSRGVTYKAVFKALQELCGDKLLEKENGGYKLSVEWLKAAAVTSTRLVDQYVGKPFVDSSARVTVFKFSDEFYRLLIDLLVRSDEIRLSSKTPALFLSEEAEGSSLRNEYVDVLWKNIRAGKSVYYLFSSELAQKIIEDTKDDVAVEKLRELLAYSNLHIKHAPLHSVVTLAVTKDVAVIGLASPSHTDLVGFIKIEGHNLSAISDLYDSVFANALPLREFIQRLK